MEAMVFGHSAPHETVTSAGRCDLCSNLQMCRGIIGKTTASAGMAHECECFYNSVSELCLGETMPQQWQTMSKREPERVTGKLEFWRQVWTEVS